MKRILLSVLIIGLALTILFPLSVSAKREVPIKEEKEENPLDISDSWY